MSKVFLTGTAGFIGFHLCQKLLARGDEVLGIDNLNDYYDVSLKEARLEILKKNPAFTFEKLSLEDNAGIGKIFADNEFPVVVNLAAQVGVRYSVENPSAYISSNLTGFGNILEACRHNNVKHLVYASSSSVYGANRTMPFSESDNVDHPVSLYAATKKANELMAHTYSSLYDMPTTGLRFFTVYGPWGRPDMALFKFTKAIFEGRSIDVYNHGDMRRDFTYVDDIVDGIMKVMDKTPTGDPSWSGTAPTPGVSYAPYRVYNIGNHKSEPLLKMIEVLENAIGKKAEKNFLPIQMGDMQETAANISALQADCGFEPKTSIEIGIPNFVKWYREFYNV